MRVKSSSRKAAFSLRDYVYFDMLLIWLPNYILIRQRRDKKRLRTVSCVHLDCLKKSILMHWDIKRRNVLNGADRAGRYLKYAL